MVRSAYVTTMSLRTPLVAYPKDHDEVAHDLHSLL